MGARRQTDIEGRSAGLPKSGPCAAKKPTSRQASISSARVTQSGGQVMMGPIQVPGGDWVIHGRDPQGAAFALFGKKKG